jgi:hypothetical protein
MNGASDEGEDAIRNDTFRATNGAMNKIQITGHKTMKRERERMEERELGNVWDFK